MNAADCEFVMIGGLWLPAVAGIERTPVYIGDYERAVSGVLRTAHVGKAMEWRVLLQGVAGEDVEALEEVLRSPVPVGCNIMGTEVIASVTELSSSHAPKRHGPDADWGRMNYEILVREVVVENIMPGFTYEYQAFTDTGAFTWDWTAAGQPDEVDVLLVAGGGSGGYGQYGGGGGGAGGVLVTTAHPVSGNLTGSVGDSDQDTTVSGLPAAVAGGVGGGPSSVVPAGDGGSGGGSRYGLAPGQGTLGQGSNGKAGRIITLGATYTAGGGGGGASGMVPAGASNGIPGVDLLALGWNYRLIPGVPRFVGGGGGGGGTGSTGSTQAQLGTGEGGLGGGGRGHVGTRDATAGAPNTGGGGGGTRSASSTRMPGGSGLVIVRWLVNP